MDVSPESSPGIYNQIDRITNEVSTQTSLITQIATALEGKAAGGSGGGAVETCTVVIQNNYEACYGDYTATGCVNGEIVPISGTFTDSVTIDNVVVSAPICLSGNVYASELIQEVNPTTFCNVLTGTCGTNEINCLYVFTATSAGSVGITV